MFFKECDDYVDGGVLANNPSETGLTAIQDYFHSRGLPMTTAIVVRLEFKTFFSVLFCNSPSGSNICQEAHCLVPDSYTVKPTILANS